MRNLIQVYSYWYIFCAFLTSETLLSIQIGSHPNIYVLDTPAVLSPEIPDVDVLSKLILTGMFKLVFFFHGFAFCFLNGYYLNSYKIGYLLIRKKRRQN